MAASKKYEVMFSIAGRVASSFSGAFKGANKAITEANNKTKQLKASMEGLQNLASKGLAIGGAGLAGAGLAAKEAIAFESAMADVKKVFSGTDEELKKLNDEILNMSTRLPMAANDIAKISAAAGQAGIATGEITKFTEDAVKMGVAFDITAEEAGQAMAELRTAFKMSQTEVVELADKINYLGNTTPATAKGITEIVQRIGPLGEVGGYASGSIAALGATIRGMGVAEEVAATGIKNMMLALVAGESATKGQKAAYAALGLESTAVAKAMQKDSEKTTLTVLKAVAKLDKYKQAATLKELFGSESLGSIAPLLTNMEALEKNLSAVADASKYAGSMEAEYAARAATTENQIILAKNAINVLAIEIGSTFLPVINKSLEAFKNIIADIRGWTKANPELAASLSKWSVILFGVIAGVSALAIGLVTFIGPIIMVAKTFGVAILVFGKVVMWIKNIALAVRFLSAVFLANPIAIAIMAIVAVVWLLWKNWDTVTKYASKAWDWIKAKFSAGASYMGEAVAKGWGKIKSAFNTGVNFIKNIIKAVDTVFAENPILNFMLPIIGIPRMIIANWGSITQFFSTLWSAVSAAISAKLDSIGTMIAAKWNSVKTFFAGLWEGIETISSNAWNGLTALFMNYTPIGLLISNWSKIKTFFSTLWLNIGTTASVGVTSLVTTIRNMPLLQAFSTVWNSVINFLSTLGTRMLDIGRNIINGLIDGIRSGFEKLKEIWNTVNSFIPDFARKKMDIHSPSRVMAEIGGHITGGLGVGIQSGFPAVQNTMDTGLNSVLPQTNGQSLAGGMTGGSNITVTINQAISGDQNVAEQAKVGVMDAVKQMQAHNSRNNRLSFA